MTVCISDLNTLYDCIGKNVECRGRVAAARRLVDNSDGRPRIALSIESLEGEALTLSVEWPVSEQRLPYGIVHIIGRVEAPSKGKKERRKLLPVKIIATSVEPEASSWRGYHPTPIDLDVMSKLNGISYDALESLVDRVVAPEIAGRPLEKLGNLLTVAQPRPMPLRRNHFELTTMNCGKEREGKDAIAESACSLAPERVEVNAEISSRAGFVGGVCPDPLLGQDTIKWGALPQAHETVAHIRGVSAMPPERVGELRETLATRKAKIDMIMRGERPAEARLILSANSAQPTDTYPTLYDAARNIGANGCFPFQDSPDFKRLHLIFVFDSSTGLQQKFEAQMTTNQEDVTQFRNAFCLAIQESWALTRADIVWDMDAIKTASRELAALAKQLKGVDLAILDSEGIYILCAIAGGFSVLTQCRGEDGRLHVGDESFANATRFVREMVGRLQVGLVAENLLEKEASAHEAARLIVESLRADRPDDPTDKYAWALLNTKEAAKTVTKAICHLFKAHRPMTWALLSEEMKVPQSTLRRKAARVYAWLTEELYPAYGAVPPILVGQANQGVQLSAYGVIVAKHMVVHNSAQAFTADGEQLGRIDVPARTSTNPCNLSNKKEEKEDSICRENSAHMPTSDVQDSEQNDKEGERT